MSTLSPILIEYIKMIARNTTLLEEDGEESSPMDSVEEVYARGSFDGRIEFAEELLAELGVDPFEDMTEATKRAIVAHLKNKISLCESKGINLVDLFEEDFELEVENLEDLDDTELMLFYMTVKNYEDDYPDED